MWVNKQLLFCGMSVVIHLLTVGIVTVKYSIIHSSLRRAIKRNARPAWAGTRDRREAADADDGGTNASSVMWQPGRFLWSWGCHSKQTFAVLLSVVSLVCAWISSKRHGNPRRYICENNKSIIPPTPSFPAMFATPNCLATAPAGNDAWRTMLRYVCGWLH